jgi:hypothetical protein
MLWTYLMVRTCESKVCGDRWYLNIHLPVAGILNIHMETAYTLDVALRGGEMFI